jgi:hypothetical protein
MACLQKKPFRIITIFTFFIVLASIFPACTKTPNCPDPEGQVQALSQANRELLAIINVTRDVLRAEQEKRVIAEEEVINLRTALAQYDSTGDGREACRRSQGLWVDNGCTSSCDYLDDRFMGHPQSCTNGTSGCICPPPQCWNGTVCTDITCPEGYILSLPPWPLPQPIQTDYYYCKINKTWNQFSRCTGMCPPDYTCMSQPSAETDYRCVPTSHYLMSCGCEYGSGCWCT